MCSWSELSLFLSLSPNLPPPFLSFFSPPLHSLLSSTLFLYLSLFLSPSSHMQTYMTPGIKTKCEGIPQVVSTSDTRKEDPPSLSRTYIFCWGRRCLVLSLGLFPLFLFSSSVLYPLALSEDQKLCLSYFIVPCWLACGLIPSLLIWICGLSLLELTWVWRLYSPGAHWVKSSGSLTPKMYSKRNLTVGD